MATTTTIDDPPNLPAPTRPLRRSLSRIKGARRLAEALDRGDFAMTQVETKAAVLTFREGRASEWWRELLHVLDSAIEDAEFALYILEEEEEAWVAKAIDAMKKE
jgi:hypothetical protein